MEEKVSFFTLSVSSLSFEYEGGRQEIGIESNVEWEISALPSWLSIAEQSEQHIAFVAATNDTENARNHQVIFSANQEEYVLSVRQKAKGILAFEGEKELNFTFEENQCTIKVKQNVSFETKFLDGGEEWLSLSSQIGNVSLGSSLEDIAKGLSLRIKENRSQDTRKARLVIYNETQYLSDTIFISQEGKSSNKELVDGECLQIQQATNGKVNLVIMGDGFTSKDLSLGGTYEQIIRNAADYFFSIEPYKTYRDYFNVYMVVAESESEGVGNKGALGLTTTHNKFGTAFGSGTEVVCDADLVFEYARKVESLPEDKPLTVIVVLNSTKYAGTAYLYADGNSIALCPMSNEPSPNDFEGVIHHEAGGHGFGFLCDEYVYYQKTMPSSRVEELREWQQLGFQMNLDFTNDSSAILWKDFIGKERYERVGAYEGGYEYQYGVWRSEKNSCMNNNIPYYNVQSRWSIVSRIMKLSDKEFGIPDFIENDRFTYPEESATRSETGFVPLGSPVWIM